MENDLIKFNDVMQELMSLNSLDMIMLAKTIEIDRNAVENWFCGRSYPKLDSLIKLANCFNCSIDYLFKLTVTKEFSPKITANFTTRYRELTKEKGLTDYRISKLCGTNNSKIAKWRNNGVIPETAMLIKLAEIFGCSFEYLIGRR